MRLRFLHPRQWGIELLFLSSFTSTALGITGAYWDIGWHFDYGRDTFWSPPHLLIYGAIMLGAFFFALNLIMAVQHRLAHREHALFHLLLFGLGALVIVFASAPIDEIWHRRYGVDIQIMSLPHLMLLFGNVLGAAAVLAILRYHILHERKKYLLKKVLIPVIFAGILAATILMFGENEFLTLPPDHPAAARPSWLYPAFATGAGIVIFLIASAAGTLRWAATSTFVAYAALRTVPILWNGFLGMDSVPIVPPFLLLLLPLAVAIDLVVETNRGRLI